MARGLRIEIHLTVLDCTGLDWTVGLDCTVLHASLPVSVRMADGFGRCSGKGCDGMGSDGMPEP